MNTSKSTEIKVGIVSILAIVMLLVGIGLGKGLSVSSQQEIVLRFPNSGGIQETSPLVVNGVRRGSVKSIENDNGSVKVIATIDNTSDFKQDVSAKITILEITGGKKIEIYPGSLPTVYNSGNEIKGTTPPDIAALVTLVGEVSGDAVTLVRRLDTIANSATDLLADGQVVADLKATVSNARELSAKVKDLVNTNEYKIQTTIDNIASLSSELKDAVEHNRPGVENIIKNLDETVASLKPIISKTDTAIENANILITDLDKIAKDIQNTKGLVNKLIYDEKFAGKLDSSLTDIYKFIMQVQQHGVNVNLRLGSNP